MNLRLSSIGAVALVVASGMASLAHAVAVPGAPASDFQLTDLDGRAQKLSQYRGKFVVVEWFNAGCPFVQKHYESGNMQSLQKRWTEKGVVWLVVNSTHPQSADFRDTARSQSTVRDWKMLPTALMLDTDGKVGTAWGAKATPHMFVVDPKGTVIYAGAIDDKATWKAEDVKTAKNWVSTALDEAMAGKPVSTASTAPYGCSVKY
jgi:peroxiredoxin